MKLAKGLRDSPLLFAVRTPNESGKSEAKPVRDAVAGMFEKYPAAIRQWRQRCNAAQGDC